MSILKDVLAELFSMFVADARLTAAVLATVLIAAALPPLAGGAELLLGCVVVLMVSVRREAMRRKK